MNIFRISCRSLSSLLLLLGLVVSSASNGSSQASQNWSPQQRIPGYADETLPPYLVADQNRTVHAFTSQWVGVANPQLAVVYNQWTFDAGWTPVVDILLSPLEQARVMGVFLDPNDIMHLIFFGGDDRLAHIYYTRAPAVEAGRATSWDEPQLIGREANTPNSASLAGDKNGNLVVLYSGKTTGNGVYSIYSSDSGNNWSESTLIYQTNADELKPFGIKSYMGQANHLHAVWNVVDPNGQNQSGHYTRLDTVVWKWVEPVEFDQGIGIDRGMGISIPVVIEHDGEVLIMYNNGIPPTGVPPGFWLRKSGDFGDTWSMPVRPFPKHVGRNGAVSFVVDSNNDLHVFFGERTILNESSAIHGMWHSIRQNNTWLDPVPVVSGPPILGGSKGFDPTAPQAVISQGNKLFVTWYTDPGNAKNGVWYSHAVINAPELPVIPLWKHQVTNTPVTAGNSILLTSPIYTDGEEEGKQLNPLLSQETIVNNTPGILLTTSIFPVVLLLIIVAIIQKRRLKEK
jgi:hypothetical protein